MSEGIQKAIEERLGGMRKRCEAVRERIGPHDSRALEAQVEVFGRELAELNERLAGLGESLERVARNGEEALAL